MIIEQSEALLEICERLKHMGYGVGKHIRMYGERFEILSDPFADGDGIAVLVKPQGSTSSRVVRLPATVIQTASRAPKRTR